MTTQKITASERLPEICEGLRPLLTTHGFTLRRRAFRRVAEPGLVHVISLGAGQNWSMYNGKFTVDVGIYIDEVFRSVYHWRTPPRIVMLADCEITRRLPAFQPGVEDYWWELHWPVPTVCRQIGNLLTLYGIPFLDSLSTRHKIADQWTRLGDSIGLPPRGRLDMAIIQQHLGNHEQAQLLIRQELADHPPDDVRRPFIEAVILRLGLAGDA